MATEKEKFIKELRKIVSMDKEISVKVKDTDEPESKEETKEVLTDENEEKFVDINGIDGVVFRIPEGEEFSEGVEISIVKEDGSVELTPDSSYELQDGTKFSTDSDSKIIDIVKVEEEPEEMENDISKRIEKLEELVKSLLTDNELMKTESEQMKKDKEIMSKKIIELSNEPAEEEVKVHKTGWDQRTEKRLNNRDKLIQRVQNFNVNNNKNK